MEYLWCILIGYMLGSISFATIVSKIKKVNLKENGTKNLGATNTMLVMGKGYGVLVMLLDVFKTVLAINIARIIFPQFYAAGILTGTSSVLGHICPFYLKFKGGKGLACYAGMILALDPVLFVFMLVLCVGIMIIVNHSVIVPYTAAVVFPLFYCIQNPQPEIIIIAIFVGVLLAVRHIPDIIRAKAGGDSKIRDYFKEQFRK
ncbi:MAG: glycerol-3-phosphate acyltransferase [Clostridia bacterium]|nr:glycerol-3-phosphate acyltransferase [Clostridia bacterium]